MFRANHRPYNPKEIEIIKDFCALADHKFSVKNTEKLFAHLSLLDYTVNRILEMRELNDRSGIIRIWNAQSSRIQ